MISLTDYQYQTILDRAERGDTDCIDVLGELHPGIEAPRAEAMDILISRALMT